MGLNEMMKRMAFNDMTAQTRMIKNKQKTLKDNIDRSYFGFSVKKPAEDDNKIYRVSISDATSLTIDNSETKKDISCFFEDGFHIGTIVHWLYNNSYWIICEKEENEIAYFQGKMVEASNFQIVAAGEEYSTWGSLKLSLSEEDEMFDKTLLTYETTTITLRIPDNKKNREVFGLDKKIKVLDTTWKIYNIDYISNPGIILIKGKRNFDSISIEEEITMTENNIVSDNNYIDGPDSIVPFESATYRVKEGIDGIWSIPDNPNIIKTINNDNSITIVWNNGRKRNDFTIYYGEFSKVVKVESLL